VKGYFIGSGWTAKPDGVSHYPRAGIPAAIGAVDCLGTSYGVEEKITGVFPDETRFFLWAQLVLSHKKSIF
jgi:hypothetical protein